MIIQRVRMMDLVLLIMVSLLLLGLATESLPDTLVFDFSSRTTHGTLEADGTYVFYSRGPEVTLQFLHLPEARDAKIYAVEFPIVTQDGGIVNGMFYVYGEVNDDSFTKRVFLRNGHERQSIVSGIPQAFRAAVEKQVKKLPSSAFRSNSLGQSNVKSAVLKDMETVWKSYQFTPQVVSILIRADQ